MGIPVRQLLAQHSSYELREWMAYEMHAGPLGPRWQNNLQAESHYLLQWTNYLLGAQFTPKGKKNPVPQPKFPDRPWVYEPDEEDRDEEEAEELVDG